MFKLAERKTENSELVKIKMEMSAVDNQCLGFFPNPYTYANKQRAKF